MEIHRPRVNDASDFAAQQANDLFDSLELAKAVDSHQFKTLLDHIPVAIVASKQMGGEHRIVYANKSFELKTGRTAKEISGRSWLCLNCFHHEGDPAITIGSALLNGDEHLGSFSLIEPDPQLFEVYAGAIESDAGRENYQVVALVDITARDRAQREKYEKQIRYKDVLLSEIQHRVRNNLQLIALLIRLEARSARLGEPVNLERLAGRIEAMKFLYDELSPNPVADTVDLAHYLSNIASGVMRTAGVDGIRLELRVESASASINVAMPLGLIVNELLTNAFKYAFRGRDTGTITIHCLRSGDEWYEVMIADDGVGFPPGVRWPMEGKLGALIFQTLRENVRTELKFESAPDSGSRITIGFERSLRQA